MNRFWAVKLYFLVPSPSANSVDCKLKFFNCFRPSCMLCHNNCVTSECTDYSILWCRNFCRIKWKEEWSQDTALRNSSRDWFKSRVHLFMWHSKLSFREIPVIFSSFAVWFKMHKLVNFKLSHFLTTITNNWWNIVVI